MKRNLLFILLILVCVSLAHSITVETASLKGFMYGSAPECEYDDWISHHVRRFAVNGYNEYAPYYRNHRDHPFGTFRVPSNTDLANWELVVAAFMDGDYETAEELLIGFEYPYTVVEFHDTDTGKMYYMLRESLNMNLYDDHGTSDPYNDVHGGFDFGWGLFIFSPESYSRIIVNIVHPADDFMVPPLAVDAFQKWDARYLTYASACREARWTQEGNYTNDKSLADPSRHEPLPYNIFYKAACNDIRALLGVREFSAQIHSFDWNSSIHVGAPPVQVSAGNSRSAGPSRTNNSRSFPTLPIRDLSSQRMDLINQTNHLVFPANTIGVHPPIYINDYYGVYYSENEAPFFYDNGDVRFKVNDYVSLWGAEHNVQYLYTLNDLNRHDSIGNFFHIEFSELPHCYPRSEHYYRWFHGYDINLGRYDLSRRFDNALAFYSPVIDNMKIVLEAAFSIEEPPAPSFPESLRIIGVENTRVTIGWEPVDQFNFRGYEIYYSTTPNNPNPTTLTRALSQHSNLANAQLNRYQITGLSNNTTYYIRMRAMDQNFNLSPFSPEISVITVPPNLSAVSSRTLPPGVTVTWQGANQTNLYGYRIYKAPLGGQFTLFADWNTHPSLRRTANSQTCTILDSNVELFGDYQYQIAMVSNDEEEFLWPTLLYGHPRPFFTVYAENTSGSVTNNCSIGYGPHTSDGIDNQTYYDITKNSNLNGQYTDISIWKANWYNGSVQGVRLQQEYIGEFDINNEFRTFRLRVRTNQSQVRIRVDHTLPRATAKMILVDLTSGVVTHLLDGEYTYNSSSTSDRNFDLYIGNLQPVATIGTVPNRIVQGGTTLYFNVTTTHQSLLDYYKLFLLSDTDSLLVSDFLPPSTSSVPFVIPFDTTMHNLTPTVETYGIDGEVRRFRANWRVGIVPIEKTITYQAGTNFVANPFTNGTLNPSDLHPDAQLYQWWSGDQWYNPEEMYFGVGYILDLPVSVTQNYLYNIQSQMYTQPLYGGWNHFANPFITGFYLKDMSFSYNDIDYSFAELYQQNFVLSTAWVVREGLYMETDFLQPFESCMFYVNLPEDESLTATIIPYRNNVNVSSNKFKWQGIISAKFTDENSVNDIIKVAVSDFTDNPKVELMLNNPKPVKLPNNMAFYLTDNDKKYVSRTINPLSDTINEYATLPFILELPSLEPIEFYYENPVSLLNYQMVLILDNHQYNLTDTMTIEYVPNQLVIQGEIRIGNEHYVPNLDEVIKPFSFVAYPNPFNPTTNIAFNLPRDTHVELNIYNIKGQKVKTVVNDFLTSGEKIIQWHGVDNNNKSVGSGIYFVSINAKGQERVIKKITLLK